MSRADDWQLAQGTVDFRNEERRAAHGTRLSVGYPRLTPAVQT